MSEVETLVENINQIPDGYIAIDCDPEEVQTLMAEHMSGKKTVVYNGVPGIFESKYGIRCTNLLLSSIRYLKSLNSGVTAIALGGEGVGAAISVLGPHVANKTFDYLSTAGGAGLEFWQNDKSFVCLDSFPTTDGKPIAPNYANLLTIQDIRDEISGKVVLLTADLNLENPTIDDMKIQALVNDIVLLKKYSARKIIISSHRGRPNGREMKYSMSSYAGIYTEILRAEDILAGNEQVHFVDECIGEKCRNYILNLPDGSICIAENARFYEDEKNKNKELRKKHAQKIKDAMGADILIFSAAGAGQRKDASKYYLPMFFEKKAIGDLMKRELTGLSILKKPENRPVLAIIQGAKSDKLKIIKGLFELNLVDKMIILGKLATYFYNGNELASEIVQIAGNKLILPKRMTIAKIPEGSIEKEFVAWLKTQK